MVFRGVILQTTPGVRKSQEICRRIKLRLDLWEIGHHTALCADTVAGRRLRTARTTRDNKETCVRTFNLNVGNGKIRAEVRGIRGQR